MESLLTGSRADKSVDPEEPGVELLRQFGLKEDGRLSTRGREAGKSAGGYEDDKGSLGTMRTELIWIHGAFVCDGQRAFLNAGSSIPWPFALQNLICIRSVSQNGNHCQHSVDFEATTAGFFVTSPELSSLSAHPNVFRVERKGRQEILKRGVVNARPNIRKKKRSYIVLQSLRTTCRVIGKWGSTYRAIVSRRSSVVLCSCHVASHTSPHSDTDRNIEFGKQCNNTKSLKQHNV